MQTVKLLANDLTQLGELTGYTSLIFTRSWHGVGEFQLVVNRQSPLVNEIQKGTLIALDKERVGIVRHREISLDENGRASEDWVFKGPTLDGLMQQRISVPPSTTSHDRKTGAAETVIKHYVANHFTAPTNADRTFPGLSVAADQARGASLSWESRFRVIADEFEEIGQSTGLGWGITLDTTAGVKQFDVYEGVDRTVNQTAVSPVYFSPEFGTVGTQAYTDSDLNMRNFGYVGGQGEGVEREIIELGANTGADRFEVFIDARDVETAEGLQARGERKMAELENELYLDAEILTPAPFEYRKDYDLGDVVTIMNREWGVMVDRRMIEVTETYEDDGLKLEAVFGQKRPTLTGALKRRFNEIDGELKR